MIPNLLGDEPIRSLVPNRWGREPSLTRVVGEGRPGSHSGGLQHDHLVYQPGDVLVAIEELTMLFGDRIRVAPRPEIGDDLLGSVCVPPPPPEALNGVEWK